MNLEGLCWSWVCLRGVLRSCGSPFLESLGWVEGNRCLLVCGGRVRIRRSVGGGTRHVHTLWPEVASSELPAQDI